MVGSRLLVRDDLDQIVTRDSIAGLAIEDVVEPRLRP